MANAKRMPPRLGLFDRLLQGDSIETDRSVERAQRELRESIRRDLEILFNTRPRHIPPDPRLPELRKSVLSYGLPELQAQPLSTPADLNRLQILLEDIIRTYEPRLQDLAVVLQTNASPLDRTLRFRIEAVLDTGSGGEPVVYDSRLDIVSGAMLLEQA